MKLVSIYVKGVFLFIYVNVWLDEFILDENKIFFVL